MKVFFDTEFTGLHKNTTLISIGMVSENGFSLYAEFTDYDKLQIDQWLRDNVIVHLFLEGNGARDLPTMEINGSHSTIIGTKRQIGVFIRRWLEKLPEREGKVEMWSDCLAYDWVLFMDMMQEQVVTPNEPWFYIPFDICTLLWAKGIDPDIKREEYVGMNDIAKHNALHDAQVIKTCYEKLQS